MEFPASSFPFIPVQTAQVYQVGSAFLPGCKLTNSSFSKIPPVYHPAIKVYLCIMQKSKFLAANLPLKMILSYYEKLISDPMNALITVSVNLLNSLWIRILT